MLTFKSNSVDETKEFGKKLGNLLKPGDCLCLKGDLGTGKTAMTNGIAEALGIDDYITSPTFTIVNEYMGKFPLYHFDVYRIDEPDDMFEIGFDEYLSGDGIVVIEWAELIKEVLPRERIQIEIKKTDEDVDIREITVEFEGSKYNEYEELLKGKE